MKVVIVGGGFAGVKAALELAYKKGIEVTLISDQTYFEYHAALYRSATGRSPLEVAIPLKDFFEYAENVEIVEDTITNIDAVSKHVIGEDGSRFEFDSLLLALGATTEYYGIKGLQHYAYGIKTIQEALHLKRTIHEQLLEQKAEQDYVVIGAGPSGVELAAELTTYLKMIRKKHRVITDFRVELVEASSRVLAAMPEAFSDSVTKRLSSLGVTVITNTPVKSETNHRLTLPHSSIETHTVIWTAGVTNNPLFTKHPTIFSLVAANKVKVDAYLQATKDIYVLGDSAATHYSGMAQTAIYDAKFVTKNLVRKSKGKQLVSYTAKRPVYAVPVGPRWAAVLWGRVHIYGMLGSLLRRLADLRLFVTFLPLKKALGVWRYGFVHDEVCSICGRL